MTPYVVMLAGLPAGALLGVALRAFDLAQLAFGRR